MPRELHVGPRGPKKEVTVEEASHCPKCGVVGRVASNTPFIDERGTKWDVTLYMCVTESCTWFDTGWPVQSDERGIVFQRDQGSRGQDKTFEPMSADALAFGRRQLEEVIKEDAENRQSQGEDNS